MWLGIYQTQCSSGGTTEPLKMNDGSGLGLGTHIDFVLSCFLISFVRIFLVCINWLVSVDWLLTFV
jgi:hypothetical protein